MTVQEAIQARRTIRKFKQTPISSEQLKTYIDAARIAPSGGNLQPLKYIGVNSQEKVDALFPLLKWAGYLAPDYNPKPGERPMAYVVVCLDNNIQQIRVDMDAGAAIENLILAAWEDGVGSCWIASVERAGLRQLLDVPEHLSISCVVALGYSAEEPKAVAEEDGIRYYLDEEKTLCVPKRGMDDVLLGIY